MRAGLGLLDPFLDLFPDVAVGYIGLERDERTAEARYVITPGLRYRLMARVPKGDVAKAKPAMDAFFSSFKTDR